MRAVIIEPEFADAERLETMLYACDPSVAVLARLSAVEDAVRWFQSHPAPDCIFLDVQLSDGTCFDIFKQIQSTIPVIVTTNSPEFAIEAFRLLCIDYLLKPFTVEDLGAAIRKLHLLRGNTPDYSALRNLVSFPKPRYKQRFLGKVGQKLFFIDATNINCFMAENKIVYLFSADGFRYVVENTLEQLEHLLDPECFFRINRSVIVNINAIEQVKPYLNSRLKLKMRFSGVDENDLVISRERVPVFKQWADA